MDSVNIFEIYKVDVGDLIREVGQKEYLSLEEIKDLLYTFASSLIYRIDELIQKVHEYGGAVILPHPFGRYGEGETTVRYYLEELFKLNPNRVVQMEDLLFFIKEQDSTYYSLLKQIDGVEVSNPSCSWLENYFASMLVVSLGKNQVGGSDCHTSDQVGA